MLEKRVFTGALNVDDEERYVADGDYRFALNIRAGTTDGSNVGAIENTKGNVLVPVTLQSPAILKVIGSYEDKTNKKNYYFLYSKSTSSFVPLKDLAGINHHTIFEYDQATNTVAEVLINNLLNFDPDHLITGINVLDGTLFFTDDFTNPKAVDIQRGKNHTSSIQNPFIFFQNGTTTDNFVGFVGGTTPPPVSVGDKVTIIQDSPSPANPSYNTNATVTAITTTVVFGTTLYSVITDILSTGNNSFDSGKMYVITNSYPVILLEEHITAIRRPPNCDPEANYATDTTKDANYLTNLLFQFKYRWIYFNDQKSAFSPISTLPLPANTCSSDVHNNNSINIDVLTGTSLVEKIEIAARIGNIGDFFSITVLNKEELSIDDDATTSYVFRNEKVYNNVNLNESNKLFDALPRLAKAQELIDGNRITYSNILENFDLPVIDASISKSFKNQPGVCDNPEVPLGTAATFAILAGAGIINSGNSVANGDVGTHPTTTETGFSTLTINGTNHAGDATTQAAKTALTTAYTSAATAPGGIDESGVDLGTLVLSPGVYKYTGSAVLTGTLVLSGAGTYIFQIASNLTIAPAGIVNLTNGATPNNVFWQVGGSATFSAGADFAGVLMTLNDITVGAGSSINGLLLARNGFVNINSTETGFEGNPCTPISTKVYDIRGNLNIQNAILNALGGSPNGYRNFQPIWSQSGGIPGWGGVGKETLALFPGGFAPLPTYGQSIPLGGFVIYLAGTDFYAISKQVPGANSDNVNVSQDSNGVYQVTSADNLATPGHLNNQCTNGNTPIENMRCNIERENTYSQFSIPNVPPGKYVMRIASHFTTTDDLATPGKEYQNTSTNTYQIGGIVGPEAFIEIKEDGTTIVGNPNEAQTTYAPGAFIGSTIVQDLTQPIVRGINSSFPAPTGKYSTAITGYVTDKDIASPAPNSSSYLADTRIENAKVNISKADNNLVYSDHNGYFYGYLSNNITNKETLNVVNTFSGSTALNPQVFNLGSPPSLFNGSNNQSASQVIIRNTNSVVQQNARTQLKGKIVDDAGFGIQAINVIVTYGRVVSTDINGTFNPFVYRNSKVAGDKRNDFILFGTYGGSCGRIITTPSIDEFDITLNGACSQNNVSPYTGNYTGVTDTTTGLLTCPVNIQQISGFLTLGTQLKSLKRGGEYQFGMVYYDDFNRSGTTGTNDGLKLFIPFYTQLDTNDLLQPYGAPVLQWFIDNPPPTWATHYQWVRTKNTSVNRYIQFIASNIEYLNDSGTTSGANFNNANQIRFSLDLPDYSLKYSNSILSYDFVDQDRVRFIKRGGSFFSDYIDLQVLKFDTNKLYIYNDNRLGDLLSPADLVVTLEVYSPKLKNTTDIYYEISECYPISSDGIGHLIHGAGAGGHKQKLWTFTDNFSAPGGLVGFQSTENHNLAVGDIITVKQNAGFTNESYNGQTVVTAINIIQAGVLSRNIVTSTPFGTATAPEGGTISVSATGMFQTGDTYYRFRDTPRTTIAAPTAVFSNIFVDDANLSDFYISNYSDIGRPNRVDTDFKETRRPTTIFYSEKFVPETNINGLNSFFDTNFETYDRTHGSIQKTFNWNHNLEVYQELKVGFVPVNENVIIDNQSQGLVGTSALVLNKIQYYQGNFGIGLNPESFANYGNARYFVDIKRASALRLSNDGLTQISEYKMHKYFSDKAKALTNIPVKIYGTYDIKFSEYIISFDALPETLAFDEKINRWTTFYSYLPENMVSAGDGILTFKNGSLYKHNENTVYNNFYGVQYFSEIHPVSNIGPSDVKVYQSLTQETTSVWDVYEIITPGGQLSELLAQDFELTEGVFYSNFLFDKNTPNVVNPLIEGDPMRDTSLLVKLRNSSTAFVKLFAVNFYIKESYRSNK